MSLMKYYQTYKQNKFMKHQFFNNFLWFIEHASLVLKLEKTER